MDSIITASKKVLVKGENIQNIIEREEQLTATSFSVDGEEVSYETKYIKTPSAVSSEGVEVLGFYDKLSHPIKLKEA